MLPKATAKDPDTYDYWPHCKKKCLGGNVLNRMKTYDKDNVPQDLVNKM